MATIFEKIRVGTLAGIHGLLDRVIDLNSVGVIRQYLRELEAALDNLDKDIVEGEGERKTVERNFHRIEAQIEQQNRNLDFILTDNDKENDRLAGPMEAELVIMEKNRDVLREQLDTAEKTLAALKDASSNINIKRVSMKSQLDLLEQKEQAAKAQERAAAVAERAKQAATAGGDGSSVDNLAERIEKRKNVAEARLQQALGDLATGVDKDDLVIESERRLAERKARLTGQTSSGSPLATQESSAVNAFNKADTIPLKETVPVRNGTANRLSIDELPMKQ